MCACVFFQSFERIRNCAVCVCSFRVLKESGTELCVCVCFFLSFERIRNCAVCVCSFRVLKESGTVLCVCV